MTIKYTEIQNINEETQIERVDDFGIVSWIPIDPANSDYQAYLATLASESANDPAGNL